MIAHIYTGLASYWSDYMLEIKLTILAGLGAGAWLADASTALDIKGWDEMGLKAILLFAVYYIGRLFLLAQKEHKEEMAATWKAHKEEAEVREARMCGALQKTAESMERIADSNEEQLGHFRNFVKGAIDDKMRGPHS
jgi:hypothetical protein